MAYYTMYAVVDGVLHTYWTTNPILAFASIHKLFLLMAGMV